VSTKVRRKTLWRNIRPTHLHINHCDFNTGNEIRAALQEFWISCENGAESICTICSNSSSLQFRLFHIL